MEYPQTVAKNIAKNIAQIAENGCLAFSYAYCLGIEENLSMIELVSRAMDRGFLSSDCFVKDAPKYLEYLSGRKFKVIKQNITTIDDIDEPTPVKYSYNGKGHWVVVENGRIVFNSLLNSLCVTKGKPTEARILKMIKD
jgi:hypothetical protein